jgi:hypothetical protein
VATTFYLTTTTAGITAPGGTGATYLMGASAGSSTAVKATTSGAVTPPSDTTRWATAASGGTLMTWVSLPLTEAATISGSATVAIRGQESNNKAEATWYGRLGKRTAAGTYSWIGNGTDTSEFGTSASNRSVSFTPTSTSFAVGDRIVCEVHMEDAPSSTLVTGYNLTLTFGSTAYASVTETVTTTVTGPIVQSLAHMTQAATGTNYFIFTGSIAQTLVHCTQAATGTKTHSGTIAQTLTHTTQAATGTETMSGTLAQTLAHCTQAATGTVTAGEGFIPSTYGTVVYWADCTNSAKMLDSGDSPASDAEAIAKFVDSSSSGYDLSQTTDGYRPICQTNEVSELQIARFDGGDGFALSNATSSAISKNRSGLTIAVAFKPSSFAATQRLLRLDAPSGDPRLYIALLTGGNWNVNVRPQDAGTTNDLYGSASYLQETGDIYVTVFKLDWSGNAVKVWQNSDLVISDSDVGSTGNSSNTDTTSGADGNQFFFNAYGSSGLNGDLLDLVIWDGALSDGNCTDIISAMQDKYEGESEGDITGVITQTLTHVTQSATGTETHSGVITQTLTHITQAASGTKTHSGTITQSLTHMTQAASGTETYTGAISQLLAHITQALTGTNTEVGVISGSISQTLSPITQSLTGELTLTGAITQTLSTIAQAATGTVTSSSSELVGHGAHVTYKIPHKQYQDIALSPYEKELAKAKAELKTLVSDIESTLNAYSSSTVTRPQPSETYKKALSIINAPIISTLPGIEKPFEPDLNTIKEILDTKRKLEYEAKMLRYTLIIILADE